jgi:Secretion system C-terminal sorting domain
MLFTLKKMLLGIAVVAFATTKAQGTFTTAASGNWNNTSTWTLSSGTDGDGLPDANDNVSISTGRIVTLTQAESCANFTQFFASAGIAGGGFALTSTGVFNSSLGSFTNGTLVLTGSNVTIGNNTGAPVMNMTVIITSPTIVLRSTVYNFPVTVTKTAGATDYWGGNTFMTTTTFINNGAGRIAASDVAVLPGDIYNGILTVTNTSTGVINLATTLSTSFNENIIVNSTGSGRINIGDNFGASTLAAGKTITVGASGFNSGFLDIAKMTATTPLAFTLGGTASLFLGGSYAETNTFNAVNFTAPNLVSLACIYNGPAVFVKTGSSVESCGANTFNSTFDCTTTSNVATTGYLRWSALIAPDTFIGVATVTATGNSSVYLSFAYNVVYTNSIVCNSTAALPNGGIRIGENGGESTLLDGVLITTPNFSNGTFVLKNIRQTSSITPQNWALTGTAEMYLGYYALDDNIFESDVTASATNFVNVSYNQFKKNLTLNTNSIEEYSFNKSNKNGGVTSITKTGVIDDYWAGNNVFYGNTDINWMAGTGNLLTVNTNLFVDTFKMNLTINSQCLAVNSIALSNLGATHIEGNLILNSSGTSGGIVFKAGGTTQGSGSTIATPVFSSGVLRFEKFRQTAGPTNIISYVTNTADLQLVDFIACKFYNSIRSNSKRYGIRQTQFFGDSLRLFKASSPPSGADVNYGDNYFGGITTLINEGEADMRFTTNAGSKDTFALKVYTESRGSVGSWINFGEYGNTYFYDNIEFKVSATAAGIRFCNNAGTNFCEQKDGKILITNNVLGGSLLFKRFRQIGPSLAEASNLTGTGAFTLISMTQSVFYNQLNVVFSNLNTQFTNYKNVVILEKTGDFSNSSSGGNVFEKPLSIKASGIGSILMATLNNLDTYDDLNVFITGSTATNFIKLSVLGGSIVNGNILLTSSGSGDGVFFGNGASGGVTNHVSGKTINTVTFSAGRISLDKYIQQGAAIALNSVLTNTAAVGTMFINFSEFTNNLKCTVAGFASLNSSNYRNVTRLTKTGSRIDQVTGGNTFYDSLYVNNNGTNTAAVTNAAFEFGTTALGDNFNGVLSLKNTSTGFIRMSKNATSNFLDNITIESSGMLAGTHGVYFGNSSTSTGWSIHSAGKTVSTVNCNSGLIQFNKFNQAAGSQVNTLTLTNFANLQMGGTGFGCLIGGIWNANVVAVTTLDSNKFKNTSSFTSGRLSFRNNEFNVAANGTTTLIKNGGSTDNTIGGNRFDGTTFIRNNASILGANFQISNTAADDFNADVTFSQANGGTNIQPTWNKNSTYAGSIYVESPSTVQITFGGGGSGAIGAGLGVSILDGTSTTSVISKISGGIPVFNRLKMLKTAVGPVYGDVTLNTRINIANFFEPTTGVVNTDAVNIMNLNAGAVTNIGNTLSYVDGPLDAERNVNAVFTLLYPIGKVNDWRPAELTVTASVGANRTYRGEVFNASAEALGWTKPATINLVSLVHYWDFSRRLTATGVADNAGISGNQVMKLYYGANDGVSDPSNLRMAKNTPTALTSWIDIGGTGTAVGTGSITCTSSPSTFVNFSRFTLANVIGGVNPLPIELLSFNAQKTEQMVQVDWSTASEKNANRFEIERSSDGISFEKIDVMKAVGTSSYLNSYQFFDRKPFYGLNYYRLKQIDNDNTYQFSEVRVVDFISDNAIAVFPNPTEGLLTIVGVANTIVIVSDLNGAIVVSAEVAQEAIQIDLREHASGLYFVKIVSNNGTKTVKINKK